MLKKQFAKRNPAGFINKRFRSVEVPALFLHYIIQAITRACEASYLVSISIVYLFSL